MGDKRFTGIEKELKAYRSLLDGVVSSEKEWETGIDLTFCRLHSMAEAAPRQLLCRPGRGKLRDRNCSLDFEDLASFLLYILETRGQCFASMKVQGSRDGAKRGEPTPATNDAGVQPDGDARLGFRV